MASSSDNHSDDDRILISKINAFVSKDVSESLPEHVFRGAQGKKEVEEAVAKKFFEFISVIGRDFIPPGFIFWASDRILIHMLVSRNANRLIECIPEFDIYANSPQQLSEYLQTLGHRQCYFFTHLKDDTKNAYTEAASGCWKVVQVNRQKTIDGRVVEMRCLGFYEVSFADHTLTGWRVFEFGLLPFEDNRWVLCGLVRTNSTRGDEEAQTLELLSRMDYR